MVDLPHYNNYSLNSYKELCASATITCFVYYESKVEVLYCRLFIGEYIVKPETTVRLVEILETLNKNRKLLYVAAILAIALAKTKFDVGILGDENPRDWAVL